MNKSMKFSNGVVMNFKPLDSKKIAILRSGLVEAPVHIGNAGANYNHPAYVEAVEKVTTRNSLYTIAFVAYHSLLSIEKPTNIPDWNSSDFKRELQDDYGITPSNNLDMLQRWVELYALPDSDSDSYLSELTDYTTTVISMVGVSEKK